MNIYIIKTTTIAFALLLATSVSSFSMQDQSSMPKKSFSSANYLHDKEISTKSLEKKGLEIEKTIINGKKIRLKIVDHDKIPFFLPTGQEKIILEKSNNDYWYIKQESKKMK